MSPDVSEWTDADGTGFIPVVGDATDAILNYTLVVKPARKLDLPANLTTQMLFNNAVSAGIGYV